MHCYLFIFPFSGTKCGHSDPQIRSQEAIDARSAHAVLGGLRFVTLGSVTNRELEAAAGLVTRLLIHNGEQCSPFHQPLDIPKQVVVTLPIVDPHARLNIPAGFS